MKILSFGSLNYDYTYEVEHFLAPKETLAAKSMQRGFGGKGANQSIAFARAGLSVYHAGRVGADGQPFVNYLKQNGIHTDYLIKDDAAAPATPSLRYAAAKTVSRSTAVPIRRSPQSRSTTR